MCNSCPICICTTYPPRQSFKAYAKSATSGKHQMYCPKCSCWSTSCMRRLTFLSTSPKRSSRWWNALPFAIFPALTCPTPIFSTVASDLMCIACKSVRWTTWLPELSEWWPQRIQRFSKNCNRSHRPFCLEIIKWLRKRVFYII